MSETSPTETGVENSGPATGLPENQPNPSADEQQTESVSGGDSQETEPTSGQPGGGQTTDDSGGSSSDDDGLTKFAKSQGIDDLSELSDREKQLLKTAHDNQKAYRNSKNEENDGQLKETVEDVNNLDDGELEDLDEFDAREARRDSEIAQLRAAQRANDFWATHQEDRKYEGKMAELILQEKEKNGPAAARYLAQDLNRVLILAKATSSEEIRSEAAREERERLRQRQEAGADGGAAQQPQTSSKKVTREDIRNMEPEEYQKFRESGELDAAIARGDLY